MMREKVPVVGYGWPIHMTSKPAWRLVCWTDLYCEDIRKQQLKITRAAAATNYVSLWKTDAQFFLGQISHLQCCTTFYRLYINMFSQPTNILNVEMSVFMLRAHEKKKLDCLFVHVVSITWKINWVPYILVFWLHLCARKV